MAEPGPIVSVCIPVRNGAATLPTQLAALAKQRTSVPFEVVVGDNGSTDETVAVALSHRGELRISIADASHRSGVNAARNSAVRASCGDYVLLCDADDEVHTDWVEQMTSALETFDCVSGVSVVQGDGGVIAHRSLREVGGTFQSPLGANCGFRRRVYEAIGGFDEEFVGGSDEHDFFLRAHQASATIGVADRAFVLYDEGTRSPARELQRSFVRGFQQVRLYRKHRTAGLRPMSIRSLARDWGRVVRRLSRFPLLDEEARRGLAALAGRRLGRICGSVRFRVWYL